MNGNHILQDSTAAGRNIVDRATNAAKGRKNRSYLPPWLIACCIGMGAALLSFLIVEYILGGWFDNWEQASYDRLIRQHAKYRPCKDLSRVVIVAVDPASEKVLGPFPWPRSTQAKLVKELKRTGFSVIGLDEIFDRPSPLGPKDDQALAAAANEAGNVVWQCLYPDRPDEKMKKPLPILGKASGSQLGFANVGTDLDYVVRAIPGLYRNGSEIIPSFPVAVTQLFYHRPSTVSVQQNHLCAPGLNIPLDPRGHFRIRYSGPAHPLKPPKDVEEIRHISCSDLITMDPTTHQVESNGVEDNFYKGKIALVGRWDQLDPDDQNRRLVDEDLHLTPWTAVADLTDPMHKDSMYVAEGRMYGTEITAQAILALLDGIFIYPVSDLTVMGLAILLCVVVAWISWRVNLWFALLPTAALMVIYVETAVHLFLTRGIWLQMYVVPLALALSYVGVGMQKAIFVSLERRRTFALFSRYVAPKVAHRLMNDPDALRLGMGRNMDVTVLFCDIRNFTSRSEKLQPEQVLSWLNEHLSVMVEAIRLEDGTVDKYVGDAIMGVFGAPEPQSDHAARAVRAALAMSDALDVLNERRQAQGSWTYEIGIGLHSGPVVTGSMGHPTRVEYAVMGDTVNTASRIESLTKEFQARLLISEETCAAAGEVASVGEYVGEIPVKGRAKPVAIYKLIQTAAARAEQFADEKY